MHRESYFKSRQCKWQGSNSITASRSPLFGVEQWGINNVDGLEGSVYFPITVTKTMAAMAIHYAPTGATFRDINLVGLFNDGIKLKNSLGSTSYNWIAICQ